MTGPAENAAGGGIEDALSHALEELVADCLVVEWEGSYVSVTHAYPACTARFEREIGKPDTLGLLQKIERVRREHFAFCPPRSWDGIQADELFADDGEPLWNWVGVIPPADYDASAAMRALEEEDTGR